MAEIIDGKELAKKVRKELKKEVETLKEKGINPKLAVIMVGNDPGSTVYVRNKSKACEKVGIEFEEFLFDEKTEEKELLDLIDKLNEDDSIHGILLQCPVPKHIDVNKAFRRISPNKDVDGFNPINVGNLTIGEDAFISCTPYGVVKMFEEYNIETEGKRAVILGRSNIVGKPMIQCMLNKNSTVTVCHSRTQNIGEVIKEADIVIAAIGKPNFVKADMVKDGAVVIDVGINRLEDGTITGDVDYEKVAEKASFITPVPGGVGLLTRLALIENVFEAYIYNNEEMKND